MSSSATSSKGISYSAALHGIMLLLLLFGLPSFLRHHMDAEPQAITVDILPIAPMSNIKPQETPTPKTEQKKPVAEEKTEKKATPEARKEQTKAEEIPERVPAKQVMKKQEKKKAEKKPQKKEEDLESVLKSVKESAKAEASKKPTEKAVTNPDQHKAVSQNYNPAMPLSMSEKDAIRGQFQKCWEVPAGAKDAYNLVVNLHIALTEDGSVTTVELSQDQGRYASDSFFRAAADSAIRAVKRCSPLKSLPTEKYESWRDMELTFDPKDMLY